MWLRHRSHYPHPQYQRGGRPPWAASPFLHILQDLPNGFPHLPHFFLELPGRYPYRPVPQYDDLLQSIGCCYRYLILPANLMDRFLNVLIRCLSFFGVDYMNVMIGDHFLCMALYLVSIKYKN